MTVRYMIYDPALGFIVKDLERGEQCAYRSGRIAGNAMVDGIGKSEYEATRREVLVPVPEIQLREQVRILREALKEIRKGSEPTGRWLLDGECVHAEGHDEHEEEFPPGEEGAEWEPYTEEEQSLWLKSVVSIADRALEATKET